MGTILKTMNGGTTWEIQSSGLNNTLYSIYLINSNTAYIVGSGGKILMTTNGGTNWNSQVSGTSENLYSVFFQNASTGYIVGGYQTAMFLKTTNGGVNWINLAAGTSNPLNSVYYAGNSAVYAAGINGTILKSSNNGLNWHGQNSGTINALNEIYFFDFNTGYAVGGSGTILKTTDGGELVGIKPNGNELPKKFSLSQNYQNPFNPSTIISYELPVSSFVKLGIYDIFGREVATPVNEKQNPGIYNIEWNASNYSSGVYMYKLITNNYSETKRMVLIK